MIDELFVWQMNSIGIHTFQTLQKYYLGCVDYLVYLRTVD